MFSLIFNNQKSNKKTLKSEVSFCTVAFSATKENLLDVEKNKTLSAINMFIYLLVDKVVFLIHTYISLL